MATRQMVEDMIARFCELYGRRMSGNLVDAWVDALNRYRDGEVAKAGHKAMEECAKMPTPQDVIQRMMTQQDSGSDKFTMASARCFKCGRILLCISEPPGTPYECRECYTGMTNQEVSEKFKELGAICQ